MNDASLPQATYILNVFAQKKAQKHQVQALRDTGTLSMLVDACVENNLAMVDQFEFRKSLGLPNLEYLAYGPEYKFSPGDFIKESLDHSISALGGTIGAYKEHIRDLLALDWADCGFTPDMIKAQLYSFSCNGVLNAPEIFHDHLTRKENWMPAGRAQLISFGCRFTFLQFKYTGRILGIGSATLKDPPKYRSYPYIEYEEGKAIDIGTLRGDNLVDNGPRFKHLFLAWKV